MNKEILKKHSLFFSCLMCCLVGCSNEQLVDKTTHPTGKPVEMHLQVKAPQGSTAAANNETAINRLRMVVIASTGSTDAGRLIANKYYPTVPAGNALKEIITSGRRDVYLIANEPLGGSGEQLDKYKNIATTADMRNLSIAYQGASSTGIYTPAEMPMFMEHLNQLITVDGSNEIDGKMERVMAKVTLNLNIKNVNLPAGKPVVIDHITIKNLPKSSSLIAQDYTGALVTSERQAAGVVPAAGDYDFSSTNTFYVPEYLFNDPAKGAYIEIAGHVYGSPTSTLKYRVKLGDAMDDAKRYGNKYHITRNRHYTFTGDVKSYGEMDGVAVKVTVLPWNTVNMDDETGRYIAFTKVIDAANNEIADGSNLDDMGTTIHVECSTNIGDWYVIMRNAKGAIVDRSGTTPQVWAVTTQSVGLTIPKIGELPYLQSYTISIYNRIIAPESVGPVKELRFTQYIGFIPNSVLIAANWPTDKLPPNGLQVAKRGNKVLPSGVAESNDPPMQWKISAESTPGTAEGLGMGESSTAAMAGAGHPAAQYCRDMGEKWFLPSKDELILIFNNKSILDASFSFSALYYWSSTEYGITHSWDVNLGNGSTNAYEKTAVDFVRCVRAI